MMQAITLARYSLKRVSRNKPLWIALFALPLVVALVRCVFSGMEFSRLLVWMCPVVCLALTAGVLWVQQSVDRVSGLVAGIRSAAVSEREMLLSRVLAGGLVFLGQMVLMAVVLAVRF